MEVRDMDFADRIEALRQLQASDGWAVLKDDLEKRYEFGKRQLVTMAQAIAVGPVSMAAFAAHVEAIEKFLIKPAAMIAEYERRIEEKKEELGDAGTGQPDDYTAL